MVSRNFIRLFFISRAELKLENFSCTLPAEFSCEMALEPVPS